MAEAPDPKTFGSWEDAFKYPVAAVQGMERQLRGDINTNKERLRSLVGASYRDLLGTAESIIEMDKQMQEVEVHLGRMSSKCNTRLLEKKAANFKNWEDSINAKDNDKYAFASQMSVLRNCADVISRLLRSTDSVLLPAKVLVLSRLLYTKLSQRPQPPAYLGNLRNRLATLRRRLLAKVDKAMKKVDQSRNSLVDVMCGFALATSSSPTDVLRHYHHMRLEAIQERKEYQDNGGSISRSLRIYVNTLKDTKAVIPGQLAQALKGLTSAPLVKSSDMFDLIELNLDLYEGRLGEDIMSFTPYIRTEDLRNLNSEKLLREWSRGAFSSFLQNLRTTIEEYDDITQVMKLRNATLQLWFSDHQHAIGIRSAEVVDELRDAFNAKWIKVIDQQAASLDQVSSTVTDLFQGEKGVSDGDLSLWASSMLSIDTACGAKSFREGLVTRLQGHGKPLKIALGQYARWIASIEMIEETVREISTMRWADDLDDIEDDDDILNNKQMILSEDDPCTLREELSKSITAAFDKLQNSLQLATNNLQADTSERKAVFLLRLWREIKQNLPKSYQNPDLGLDSITTLLLLICQAAAKAPLERGKANLRRSYNKARIPGRPLWEGGPPLPNLPSPWTFRFLRELSSAMADIGTDIWSPGSIARLKQHLRASLASTLEETTHAGLTGAETYINGHSNEDVQKEDGSSQNSHQSEEAKTEDKKPNDKELGEEESDQDTIAETKLSNPSDPQTEAKTPLPNGTVHKPPSEEVQIQRLFDLLYLKNATTATDSQEQEGDPLAAVQASAERELGLPAASLKRMKKGADEYWTRTSLLFALLA